MKSNHASPLATRGLTLILALACSEARGQIDWYWDGPTSTPSSILQQITASMDEAVAYYNQHSLYAWPLYSNDPRGIRVIYDPAVPTANANYKGRISFGGSRGASTALHEISHIFGVGTYEPIWTNLISGGTWQGSVATSELQRFNGAGASLNADGSHFWPYGLNFSSEDSIENRRRHVHMVGALREDMGLRNSSATELNGDYNNDGFVDVADYTAWRDNLGSTNTLVNGFTVGGVEQADYVWWTRGFFAAQPSGSASVPEPTGLLSSALLASLARLRRGRRS